MISKTLLALAAAKAVSAHFGLDYPEWRADTLSEDINPEFYQFTYPCAGVPYDEGNITEWNGKTVKLELHHPFSYVWLNVGLGENSTNFNISLTPQFWNVTAPGTVCVNDLPWPDNVENGTIGTLQVVTSDKGSALYNCADFRYNPDAESPSNCTIPDDVDVIMIKSQSNSSSSESHDHDDHDNGDDSDESSEGSSGDSSEDDDGAAGMLALNKVTLTGLVGVGFAAAMFGF
ncbi:expression library immunization antigen 1 [Sarocladium implicatum]|nr:expression library immunization antigen 1 [Sarocladium implicatum]